MDKTLSADNAGIWIACSTVHSSRSIPVLPFSAKKDKSKFEHQHDLVYHAKWPDCDDNYIGEVGRRLWECVCDHSGKDHKSHMLKHSYEKAHKNVSSEDW